MPNVQFPDRAYQNANVTGVFGSYTITLTSVIVGYVVIPEGVTECLYEEITTTREATGQWEVRSVTVTGNDVVSNELISSSNNNAPVAWSTMTIEISCQATSKALTLSSSPNTVAKYNEETEYEIDDNCVYGGSFVKCIAATTGVYDPSAWVDDTGENASNIATNTGAIATNTGAIATNTGAIATNTGAIATNTGTIATNTDDIGTNAAAIATNTDDIATNTGAIATNAAAIVTNTDDIGTNSASIGTLAGAIVTNSDNIAVNTTDIGNNTIAIGNNTSAIAANGLAITANSDNISANALGISTNETNIANNTSAIAGNTSDIAGKEDDLGNPTNNNLSLRSKIDGTRSWGLVTAEYEEDTNYVMNDTCIYGGYLYKATGSTTGAFDITHWESSTVSVGFGFQMEYEWTSSLTTVTTGQVGVNNANPELATIFRASDITVPGNDASRIWVTAAPGDVLGFIESENNPEAAYYTVTAQATDEGDYVTIPVAYVGGNGVPENNQDGIASYTQDPTNKLPPNGSTGQHLVKTSSQNYETAWEDPTGAVKYVNTVTDMENISSPTTGDVCFVKALHNGGNFIYDATEIAADNSGTNFLGWMRPVQLQPSIKWWGAVGTLGVDVSQAFINAVAYMKSIGGGDMFLPTGSYGMNNVLIDSGLIGFSGEGPTSNILNTLSTGYAISFDGASTRIFKNSLRDLNLGNESVQGISGAVVRFNNTGHNLISNVTGGGFPANVFNFIEITDAKQIMFDNLQLNNAAGSGLKADSCIDVYFSNCRSDFNTLDGWEISNTSGVYSVNTTAFSNERYGSNVTASKYLFYSNCVTDSSGDHNWNFLSCYDLHMSASWGATQLSFSVNTTACGLYLGNVQKASFVGFQGTNNNNHGVKTLSNCEDISFIGGVYDGNGRGTTVTNGVGMDLAGDNISVHGSACSGELNNTQESGIKLHNGNITVNGAKLHDHTGENLVVPNQSGISIKNIISDDPVIVPSSSGLMKVPSTLEVADISGTTNISYIVSTWDKRRLTLIFTGNLTIGQTGNIDIVGADPTPVLAPTTLDLIFHASMNKWLEVSKTDLS